jgi:hypothetical protein
LGSRAAAAKAARRQRHAPATEASGVVGVLDGRRGPAARELSPHPA